MNDWWEKIKQHPIHSKVVSGLIVAAILAILNFVFSWNIFSLLISLAFKEWIIPSWLFICTVAVLVVILWVAIIFHYRKANGIDKNNSWHSTTNQQAYPERVRVIKEFTKPHQYIIKNNIARHIPDPPTFEYLGQLHGFNWGNSENVAPDDFKQFSLGSAIPSILPYLQALYEQKKTEFIYEPPYYWNLKDGKKDGPYCQRCYDKDNSLIRLQGYGNGLWDCKVCKNNYTDSSYNPAGKRGPSVIL